jgi:hypothetical protein
VRVYLTCASPRGVVTSGSLLVLDGAAADARGQHLIVPTQFKATQLVVAIAVWANAISARGAHPKQPIDSTSQ